MTRSSAPASITTPTSRRGASPPPTGARSVRLAEFDVATGRLDPAAVTDAHRSADAVGRDHRGVERARHDPGPRGRSSWRTPPARGCSSTRAPRSARAAVDVGRARLRRVAHVAVQVVRTARRRPLDLAPTCATRSRRTRCGPRPTPRPAGGRRAHRRTRRSPRIRGRRRVPARGRGGELGRPRRARLPAAARRAARPGPRDGARTTRSRRAHADRLLQRRRPHPDDVAAPSRRAPSRCGVATTTPSRSWPRWASPTAARSAPGSPATRPRPTSTRLLDAVRELA